ncbi:hypothetical protein LSAT2_022725 [Lamellibrachia satsuma]|nr:hypothetical protein LSAT2_022725 [Lamellibrachia satsuma]
MRMTVIYPAVKAVATARASHVHAGVQPLAVRNAKLVVTMRTPVGPLAKKGTATFLADASSVAAASEKGDIAENAIIDDIVRHRVPHPMAKTQLQRCTVAFGDNKTNSN